MKNLHILLSALTIIIFSFLLNTSLLQQFSPQATVNQNNILENFDQKASHAIYDNKNLSLPSFPKDQNVKLAVLGDSNAKKRIEVDLTNQTLLAYEEEQLVYNFLISSGKWGRTPTGVFQIWTKLRYTKMEGGSRALNTYYYLPNVPYVMYFYNDKIPKYRGFGLHGTYWHDNFGHPMSHGCLNLKTENAAQLFYWAKPDLNGHRSIFASQNNPGTQVIIYGKAPPG